MNQHSPTANNRRPSAGHTASYCLAAIATLFVSASSVAEDLGVKAGTYLPDPDGRDQLKNQVRAKQDSGEVDRFWQHYREQVLNAIRHPAPLPVRTVYAPTSEFHSVAFTLPNNFVDQNGKVVAHKGQVIEPLAISPLTSTLLFIDGRDPQQVQWAVRRGQVTRAKIVLTAGSPIELRDRYRNTPWSSGAGVPFYFDQREIIIDTLARMYGIQLASVPAALSQEGKGLRIAYGLGAPQ